MGILQSSKRPLWIGSVAAFGALILCYYNFFTSDSSRNPRPQIIDTVRSNCHKKILTESSIQNDTNSHKASLPSLLAQLWRPLVHPIEERVFITDKGERFEVPASQMRWKKPLGNRVILIDTDTRLNATEGNTMLNNCPLYYPSLPGRTGGHLNHYLYGMVYQTSTV
ncbi:unnamed protein product [Fusarium equiseti]|uniref:Uncharacterized protein n=1 Tax=Fusarium equiseti TaxID=61235 RepID=A0A8J2IGG6_FUSEQ|nr:unnamed protein product [Fusarium equiseti]